MENIEKLKYPIGRFETPTSFSDENKKKWIEILRDFPTKLKQGTILLSDEELEKRYRPKGWTIRQVVHHCADSHVNSFCRFKLALSEEIPAIKPYDESLWAELYDSKNAPIDLSLQLLDALHQRWIILLESFTDMQWNKQFRHPEMEKLIDLKTNLAIYAWHCEHHLAHIMLAKQN